ncbi:MAG: bifunctional phosphoribosylaminoimidazolecarboxamide formyltransferase/IMP cyclohydrolase [Bacteroidia bacterium]|nr:bifunctional phosphoribosylaminoimidazolecarboxamide formyltransferase/IMP cyclohydrolase [Bacteroidia bacterium]
MSVSIKQIKSALISVYYKDGLDKIAQELHRLGVTIYSTGGTRTFIEALGIKVEAVEDLTEYPSIFGGRVKTLHPKVFGGILYRRDNDQDLKEATEYKIPAIDLVVVDLYPFEETVATSTDEDAIIEKIDIGGVSLIRAGAKNFNDTVIVAHTNEYSSLFDLLKNNDGKSTIEQRKTFAKRAFEVTSHYDRQIFNYFDKENVNTLRYGENPHQKAVFHGDLNAIFEKIQGKELSYNNLLDVDAAVNLLSDFNPSEGATFGILKHNNACGIATRNTSKEAYLAAFAADTTSAFGGILICNKDIDVDTATEMNSLFFEIIIAPDYSTEALSILSSKKNRIILKQKPSPLAQKTLRTILNGTLEQDKDNSIETKGSYTEVTDKKPTSQELSDLEFALKIVKHTKSNAIVLIKNNQLLSSGTGQTSRVDALNQAIEKAARFGFDLNGAVMASDAFFPFPDCVEIAGNAGITAFIQPGGSINDKLSIDYCNKHSLAMVTTGVRHFKH